MPAKNFFLILAGIAFLAVLFIAWATFPYKLGVAPDSISYLSIAKHIAAGKGVSVYMPNESSVSKPITAWAPFYPFVLALANFCHVDFYIATWVFHLIILWIFVFLTGHLVYQFTQNKMLSLLAASFMALDPRTQAYNSWVLSEPLYMLLLYLSLFYLWKNWETQKISDLVLSAFLLGLSSITRYVGAVFIVSFCTAILLFQSGNFLKRLRDAFYYGFISSLPLGIWFFRNWSLAQYSNSSASKKAFGSLVHEGEIPVSFSKNVWLSFSHIQNWISEYWLHLKTFPLLGLGVLIVLVLFGFIFLNKKIGTLLLFIFSYVIGLSAILRLSLFSLELPDRYVYPTYGFIFLILIFILENFMKKSSRPLKITLSMILGLWAIFSVFDSLSWASRIQKTGIDESKGARWDYVQKMPWLPFEIKETPKTLLGGFQFTEGPVISKNDELFFTDMKSNKILKWSKTKGLGTLLENTGGTNGLALDSKNRLLMCESTNRRVTRLEENGGLTVLANQYQGLSLNSPNDLVVLENSSIYFTNPTWSVLKPGQSIPGIYLITSNGETKLVFSQLLAPNGLETSPDESKLYVSDTARNVLVRLEIQKDGTLKNPALLAKLETPDGICKDNRGNLLVAEFGKGTIQVISRYGRRLGSVKFPEKNVTNCARDSKNPDLYYVTAGSSVYTVKIKAE